MSSVNSILAAINPQTNKTPASSSTGGQSYADWYASLTNAITSANAASGGNGTTQFSDQMQALLTQLQAGNLVAPSGASATSGPVTDAASAVGAAGQAHHHHHHSGSFGGSGSGSGGADGMLQDVASSLTGNSASSSGSGSDNLFSSGSGLMSGVQAVGRTTAAGLEQALQAYAAMHGVQFTQNSTFA